MHLDLPAVAVLVERRLGFLHPNYSRRYGILCCGELPGGPIPLDLLFENYIYGIITYQNRRPTDPADVEAARYFALEPDAMEGLENVEPLY
jgi:hypothetical protein